MARIAPNTSNGIGAFPAAPLAAPGMTLDALMARQKEIALDRAKLQPGAIQQPIQGVAYLANVLANKLQQGRADRALAAGNQQVAETMANIDPVSGASGAQLGILANYDRDLAMQFLKERADRRALQENRTYQETQEGRINERERLEEEQKMRLQAEIDAGKKAVPSISDESALRQDVISDQAYKNMSNAMPIYQSMMDTANRDDPVSDLNLVYGLAKIMDPGSVVKEGEMIMVRDAQSLPGYLLGLIDKANGKAGLGGDVRKQIMTEANSRVQSYADQYKRISDFYSGVAGRRNIDPMNVLPSFDAVSPWTPPDAAAAADDEKY